MTMDDEAATTQRHREEILRRFHQLRRQRSGFRERQRRVLLRAKSQRGMTVLVFLTAFVVVSNYFPSTTSLHRFNDVMKTSIANQNAVTAATTTTTTTTTIVPRDFLQEITFMPLIQQNCRVVWNDQHDKNPKSLCVSNNMTKDLVQRILEHAFSCRVDMKQLLSVTFSSCLVVGTDHLRPLQDGDAIWGYNNNNKENTFLPKVRVHLIRGSSSLRHVQPTNENVSSIVFGDPTFLIPYVFPEFIHIPTRDYRGPFEYCILTRQRFDPQQKEAISEQWQHDTLPNNVNARPEEVRFPPLLSFLAFSEGSSSNWRDLHDKVRYCDYVATTVPEGLVLTNSMNIPTAILNHTLTDWEGIREYQQQEHSVVDMTLEPRDTKRKYHPSLGTLFGSPNRAPMEAGQRLMETFPFHYFTTQTTDDDDDNTRAGNTTLVVVLGSLRGGEGTWRSMFRNLLDVNAADLALVIGRNESNHAKTSIYQRAKYYWEFDEREDWADALDEIDEGWRKTVLPKITTTRNTGVIGGVAGFPGSGAIIFYARYIASQHLKTLCQDNDCPYERFVVTRSDFFYKCPHRLSALDPKYMWVPNGEDYGGITDRHLVCHRNHIFRALGIYPAVFAHPSKYLRKKTTMSPEMLIRVRWTAEGLFPQTVRRFPRVMYTCAAPNDSGRWGNKEGWETSQEDGCLIKYRSEHKFANCNCQLDRTIRIIQETLPAEQKYTCQSKRGSEILQVTE